MYVQVCVCVCVCVFVCTLLCIHVTNFFCPCCSHFEADKARKLRATVVFFLDLITLTTDTMDQPGWLLCIVIIQCMHVLIHTQHLHTPHWQCLVLSMWLMLQVTITELQVHVTKMGWANGIWHVPQILLLQLGLLDQRLQLCVIQK